jgi:hypothetical protein
MSGGVSMESSQELKINLETARENPIGFTQWLAVELLKRNGISEEELDLSLKAIKSLNKFKPEGFIAQQRQKFEEYQKAKLNNELSIEEEFVSAGGD